MNFLFKNEVIDYSIFGNGNQTILVLHGWGGCKNSFNKTLNLLKNKFRIIVLTMPTIEQTTSSWTMNDYSSLVENLLKSLNVNEVIILCHSFGFRVSMLIKNKIKILKIIITGGAGPKQKNMFKKISARQKLILLNNSSNLKNLISPDYKNLSKTNQQTFKNVVNLNLKNLTKFNCSILLFWGRKDKETPLWIMKKIKQENKSHSLTIVTTGDHFAYLTHEEKFNYEVIKFLSS
ncbi:MAG: alpha/beta hydrolase [Clostridiales bacterium]|nr:alpha/beta hydrolase [Clostridiales bacterium]